MKERQPIKTSYKQSTYPPTIGSLIVGNSYALEPGWSNIRSDTNSPGDVNVTIVLTQICVILFSAYSEGVTTAALM